MPWIIAHLLKLKSDSDWITFSVIEVYNEEYYDLLKNEKTEIFDYEGK